MYMYVLHNYLPLGLIREVQGLPITVIVLTDLNEINMRTKKRLKKQIQHTCRSSWDILLNPQSVTEY